MGVLLVSLSGSAAAQDAEAFSKDSIPAEPTASDVVDKPALVVEQSSSPGGQPNDFLLFAAPIGAPTSVVVSNAGATTEPGEPSPCGAIAATVWFSFTPVVNGFVSVDTFESNFDTVVAVYTGPGITPATLTNIACNDDILGTLQSRIAFSVVGATTYWIQLGGFAGSTGLAHLHLRGCDGQVNSNDLRANACNAANEATARPYSNGQNTAGTGTEVGEPLPCGNIGSTVWFRWTPTVANAAQNMNTVGSNYDTVLAVYSVGAGGALTLVACNDDAIGLQSSVTFAATVGTVYMIQVGGFAGGQGNALLTIA